MYVWFDGKVNPCDADYKSKLSFGDVNQDNIKNIWNNNVINKLRTSHLNDKRHDFNPCDRCGACFK